MISKVRSIGYIIRSSSVIMIISVTLYTWQAEPLLYELTHDHSGNRVGDNITVSGA